MSETKAPPFFQMAQARSLFRRFQGHEAKDDDIVELAANFPAVALHVGKVLEIRYNALGDGVNYKHQFEDDLPRLYVSPDGKQVYFIGGAYRFTSRGFIK